MTEAKMGRPRGRPPAPATEKKVRNFTFRSRGDMHDRLSEAAARHERSISEEIERRLENSFNTEKLMAAYNEKMEKLVDDLRRLAEERRSEAANARRELEITVSEAEQRMAELEKELDVMQHQLEGLKAFGSLMNVLLGEDKRKSELLRSIALDLANAPDDWAMNFSRPYVIVEYKSTKGEDSKIKGSIRERSPGR
jgi:hypothetical protein